MIRPIYRSTSARRFHTRTEQKTVGGGWGSTIVTVLEGDLEVGSYERNYPTFAAETFEPFEWDGSWYALYSRDYTSTRIMTLPDCRDIGGEEPANNGFCPVELYVPRYRVVRTWPTGSAEAEGLEFWECESEGDSVRDGLTEAKSGRESYQRRASGWQTLGTAFIAGCVWGDDSSWKLQTIDVALASKGIVARRELFGFVQLGTMPLVNAVRIYNGPSGPRATIIRQEDRDLATGSLIDPYD